MITALLIAVAARATGAVLPREIMDKAQTTGHLTAAAGATRTREAITVLQTEEDAASTRTSINLFSVQ